MIIKTRRGSCELSVGCRSRSVNGIATSASGLQLVLDELHGVFHRRVTGIHNKTYGIWWDLVECLLQRDLLWPTADVRVGYQVSRYKRSLLIQAICTHIRDPKKKKVVLIAHSQGGIIMSTWVVGLHLIASDDRISCSPISTPTISVKSRYIPLQLPPIISRYRQLQLPRGNVDTCLASWNILSTLETTCR